jgi:hypothetical protein
MEEVLLSILGGQSGHRRIVRPPMSLESIDDRALHLQTNSIEISTVKGYATGAWDYISFCLKFSLPLTPTPQTLARYIAYTSKYIASAPKYLTGAQHFLNDIYPEFDTNRAHPLVQSTIRGSKKIRADPIRRKQPLRLSHLEAFVHVANTTCAYDDLLFATLLSCCFYGCHRLGELVWKNDKDQWDWRKVIKRASLSFPYNRMQYRLPYHKGDPFYHGTDVLFTHHNSANPIALMHDYITQRDRLHGARPALFICANGSVPTRSWFDRKFFTLLDRDFGGHSPRVGAATYYASLGISESVIQALGRWSSQAWKIYIRDNPTIRAEQQLAAIRFHNLS